jgi:glycosyltransferase involved in cell wall biosynthesis
MNKFIFISIFLFFAAMSSNKINASEQKPRLSIITSIYDGDEFIKGFLEDIVQQSIFSESELILINANSPGNEEEIIQDYLNKYPNILYFKLEEDPGLYAVWNLAIKQASADILCNANIDDRSHFLSLERHVNELESNPDIDLVYSSYYITKIPNETFNNNHYQWVVIAQEFDSKILYKCLPGPRTVWRKSIHTNSGFFDETFYSAGDLEMWNRAASSGSKFKKIEGVYTLYYLNPNGISTSQDATRVKQRNEENNRIKNKYSYLWR